MHSAPPTRDRRHATVESARRLVGGAAGVAVLVVGWEVVGAAGWLGPGLPPLTDVVGYLGNEQQASLLSRSTASTTQAAGAGLVAGSGVALALAACAVLLPLIGSGIDRFVVILHAIPLLAFGPVLITSIGPTSTVVATAAIGAYYPMYVAVVTELRAVPRAYHDLAASLGASRMRTLRRCVLPHAAPAVVDGLRLAAPAALLGAILGEWFGAPRGLGVLIISSMQNYQIVQLWVAALAGAACSICAYAVLSPLQRTASRRYAPSANDAGDDAAWARHNTRGWLSVLVGLGVAGLLVATWHGVVTALGTHQLLMPLPDQVATELADEPSYYLQALGSTLTTGVAGLLLGSMLGGIVAVLCWLSRIVQGMLSPAALILRSVPIVILIPVLTRLLGVDLRTTIIIVTAISFFPAFVLVGSGLRQLPPSAADLAHVLGATRMRNLLRIAVPAAVPNLASSIRISAGSAVTAAMVTEFLTGAPGIGTVFLLARSDLDASRAWAAAIVAAVAAVALFTCAGWLERGARKRMR